MLRLGAPPQRAFDDIARIARLALRAPICLVTLVDGGRQWVQAGSGLDLRESSFCAHDDLLVVEDASRDPRFETDPLVIGEPFARCAPCLLLALPSTLASLHTLTRPPLLARSFYAGAPLVFEGERLGTLCVMDSEPRPGLAPEDAAALRTVRGALHPQGSSPVP